MPLYTFRDKNTGDCAEMIMSIAEREQYLADNPDLEQTPSAPMQIDTFRLGRMKPDSTFRDLLTGIKKRHSSRSNPSTINTFS